MPRHIAAAQVEAAVDDIIVFDGGTIGVRGVPDSGLSWAELVQLAREEVHMSESGEEGLSEESVFQQAHSTYPFETPVLLSRSTPRPGP